MFPATFYAFVHHRQVHKPSFTFSLKSVTIFSSMERKVILSNLPKSLDKWTMKQLLPCANLFVSIEINPGDSTKMIVETETREHALQVAQQLNGCEFLDSIIQARCAVIGQGLGGGMRGGSASSVSLEGKADGDSDVNMNNENGTASFSSQRSALTDVADSETQSAGEVLKVPTPTTTADGTVLRGERVPVVNAVSAGPLRCRFCLGDHETYGCKEFAEYYSVSVSDHARNHPTKIGYSWPTAAVPKIINMNAGPVIKYFERTFFKEELTRDELMVMFAYLTNKLVCRYCGAAGHEFDKLNLKPLCAYFCTDVRPTEDDMAKRRNMCKRMLGVLKKSPKAKLQRIAATESLKFWKALRSANVPGQSAAGSSAKVQAEIENSLGLWTGAKHPELSMK